MTPEPIPDLEVPAAPSSAWGGVRAATGRLAAFAATLLGATLLVQLLLALAPGDAIDLLPNGDVLRAGLEAEWGLDEPLPARLASTTARLVRGDLGTSLTYRPGASVGSLVADAAGRSLGLLAPAVVVAVGLGLALGLWTGGRPSRLRRLVQAVSVVPAFLAAYVAVTGLNAATWAAVERGWIDRPDWFALPDTPSALRTALAVAVLAVASGGLGELHAAFDGEVRRLRAAPFLEAARARGAPVWPRLLHNLVPPIASVAASRTAYLLGSLVIVEKVLLYNGAGAMLWQAARLRDYPLAIGITLVAAAVVCGARLVGDLVRIAVDPRLRSPA